MNGTPMEINMLVEKKYPLIKELLEKMLNLQLEAEKESIMAFELIKFIKSLLKEILDTLQLPPLWVQPHPITSGTVPPIPPPIGTSFGNTGSPNTNRVDMMSTTDTTNTTNTTNVAQNVVDENLPQLLDSRGGSHVTNVHAFDKEDFTSWKVRFLVFLDGLEPYLLKTLEDRPFVPMSSFSTYDNPLPNR
ncbi:hypothetical protein Tco_0139631 [Tanacetum coccineum]